ncbi:hypothetical protein, partial [Pseudomonas syringae]
TFLHQNVLINKRYIISLATCSGSPLDFFAVYKTTYPVAIGDKAEWRAKPCLETGTKSAFVKCTFY